MTIMNPSAIVFWAICSIVGFLIGGTIKSTVIGLLVGLLISFLFDVINRWNS